MKATTNTAAINPAPHGAVQTGGNGQANAQTSTGRPQGIFQGSGQGATQGPIQGTVQGPVQGSGMFAPAARGGMFSSAGQGTVNPGTVNPGTVYPGTVYPGTAQANAQTTTAAPQGTAQNNMQGVAPGSAQANAMTSTGRLPAYMQGAAQTNAATNVNQQGIAAANAGVIAGPNGTLFTDNRPNQWRYRYDNGRWWYWTPNNSWMWYNGQQWASFPQPGNAGPAAQSSASGISALPLNGIGASTGTAPAAAAPVGVTPGSAGAGTGSR
jgi:hypothetical protein